MQHLYQSWMSEMLTKTNPYTGKSLGEDPTVALIELQNEDSLFFWTFSRHRVPEQYWKKLSRQFTQWVSRKHGSLENAFDHWGDFSAPGDDRKNGYAALLDIWDLTAEGLSHGGDDKRKRAGDQAEFLTQVQRSFYGATKEWLGGIPR